MIDSNRPKFVVDRHVIFKKRALGKVSRRLFKRIEQSRIIFDPVDYYLMAMKLMTKILNDISGEPSLELHSQKV